MNKVYLFSIIVLAFLLSACKSGQQSNAIRIFHAGSLSYPFRLLTEAYKDAHQNQQFLLEAAGSLNTIRKVTDLHRQADLVGSADYALIDQLLIPEYSRFNIAFAANSIVLAGADSTLINHLTHKNWLSYLLSSSHTVGASDPHADPCGYRARLSLQLAGFLEGIERPDEQILSGKRYVERPKETDLIALLTTRSIDYLFTYESQARQYKLPYLKLSDSVNLSNPELNDWYRSATITVRGNQEGDSLHISGEAITYGISILKSAESRAEVWNFVSMMLSPETGGKIILQAGLRPLFPAFVQNPEEFPESIKHLINHQ